MGKKRRVAKRNQLAALHGRHCWLCNAPIRTHQRATLDHVIPRSKGGTHELSNLRLAHKSCNEKRKNGEPPVLLLTERMKLKERA